MARRHDPTLDMLVEDFPALVRDKDTAVVRLEMATATSPSGQDSYVSLRVLEAVSGTVLADLRLDPARLFLLLQGGSQVWPAFISPHLDRVGKRMENQNIVLPDPLPGDTAADVRRDVRKAVREQLPQDWWDTWDSYDTPRRTNRNTTETHVRRWVPITTEES